MSTTRLALLPFTDPNLRFPKKPRLAADLFSFTMPDGLGVQIRGGDQIVILRGPVAETDLSWLISALDGSRTIEQIFDERPSNLSELHLSKLLVAMHTKGVIAESGSYKTPMRSITDDTVLKRQLLFWGRKLGGTRVNNYPEDAQHKLASSRILLIGEGLFGSSAYDLLSRSGCSQMTVFACGSFLEMQNNPESSVRHSLVKVERTNDAIGIELEHHLPTTDLLVTALRNAPSDLFDFINTQAIQHNVRWLRGHDNSTTIEVGPYVNPHRSACYQCMIVRQMSASDQAIEEELFQRQLLEPEFASSGGQGESLISATLAASALVAESVRIITAIATPACENAVLTITNAGQFSSESFLKVPRCKSCYRGGQHSIFAGTK